MSATSTPSLGLLSKNVIQRRSHLDLTRDISRTAGTAGRSKTGRLDAIIVPASRPASSLMPVMELAASMNVPLVLLCSKQARIERIMERVSRTRAKCLIVNVPTGWCHPEFSFQTSHPAFRAVQAGRSSDLSLKRNLGMILARLHGWNKVVFIDDDIIKAGSLGRLAGQLDDHQVAGMIVRQHPDNSVVCHARRLAGFDQDVFVTGAVLGVHCNSLPLSFFPDIYNEDWFFFAQEAAQRRLSEVGQAVQTDYDPFASPDRASREEFGDLLAEGLFAMFASWTSETPLVDLLRRATRSYWSQFIDVRGNVIDKTGHALDELAQVDPGDRRIHAALDSLAAAQRLLTKSITPDLCTDFLEAWQEDLRRWQRFSTGVNNVRSTREAMDFLGLMSWWRRGF